MWLQNQILTIVSTKYYMSLNHIELPDSIIRELYKDNLLYAPGFVSGAPAQPAQTTITASPTQATLTAPSITQQPVSAPPIAQQPSPSAPVARQPTPEPATRQPAPETHKFLGNNRRKITILVNAPDSAFLPDDQLAFLTKILEACRMNIGDVAIVNLASTPAVITTLRQQLTPAFILLFGLEPVALRLPINFPTFKIQEYDGCTYLAAPPLEQLVQPGEESKLLKSKLWVCLKTMFNV